MLLEKHLLLGVRKKGSGLCACATHESHVPAHSKASRRSLALASKKAASKPA